MAKIITDSARKTWKFDIVDASVNFDNISAIHPLKQRDVAELIRVASADNAINQIIVFGSAVRFNCNSESDIDVIISRIDDKMTIDGDLSGIQSDMDIIFESHMGDRLRQEVIDKGVVVYEV